MYKISCWFCLCGEPCLMQGASATFLCCRVTGFPSSGPVLGKQVTEPSPQTAVLRLVPLRRHGLQHGACGSVSPSDIPSAICFRSHKITYTLWLGCSTCPIPPHGNNQTCTEIRMFSGVSYSIVHNRKKLFNNVMVKLADGDYMGPNWIIQDGIFYIYLKVVFFRIINAQK